MALPAASRPAVERQTTLSEVPARGEGSATGVSWPAVIGGAFVGAALSLILLSLGTGLGLSSISPWSNAGASSSAISKAAIAWLILTQILASAMGGYLAGRLRTKWTNVHTDEVYFRDTAHGFLAWAVGIVITAAFLTTAATSLAGGAGQRSSNPSVSPGTEESSLSPNAYFVDMLLRSNGSVAQRDDSAFRTEVARIFAHSMRQGSMSATDKAYLAQGVSARTGLNQTDAEQRVSAVFQEAQESADAARRTLAHLSLWLFVALLSGAFCASYAGTIGGRQRDHVTA
ncbi:MAG TPA: hypothetical protein VI386_08075 [Candidatus Sulfotelmatobacter sp.]